MERLGSDLWHLVIGKHKKLTLTQSAFIGTQILKTIEFIHNCGFVHRDIKPGNIMLGYGVNATKVYLIDFGIAKKISSASTQQMLVEDKFTRYRCGTTTRYASIHYLLGKEQSFRDDLESLAYSLIELYLGKLPWGDRPKNEVWIFFIKKILGISCKANISSFSSNKYTDSK